MLGSKLAMVGGTRLRADVTKVGAYFSGWFRFCLSKLDRCDVRRADDSWSPVG